MIDRGGVWYRSLMRVWCIRVSFMLRRDDTGTSTTTPKGIEDVSSSLMIRS
jgi:hypothetical protein